MNKLPKFYRFVREESEGKTTKVLMLESTEDQSVLLNYLKEEAEHNVAVQAQLLKEREEAAKKEFINKYSLTNFLAFYDHNLLLGKINPSSEIVEQVLSQKDLYKRAKLIEELCNKESLNAIKELFALI